MFSYCIYSSHGDIKLEVSNGSDATADALARKHGLINRGPVSAELASALYIYACIYVCEFDFRLGT